MSSRRRATLRSAAAAVAIAVPLLVAASSHAAASQAKPRTLRYGCVTADKVLHFVSGAARCRGARKTVVDFRTASMRVCRTHRGFARAAGPSSGCGALPRPQATRFCAARRGGTLRWAGTRWRCTKREFRVALAGRRPKPVARDDAAATDETRSTTIHVLDNDSHGRLGSVDTAGTRGTVTANPDGTITYSPDGKFESLGPGQSAGDAFGYSITGAGTRSRARVSVTVAGVDDPPQLAGLEPGTLEIDSKPLVSPPDDLVTRTLAASDVDSPTLTGATVWIAAGADTAHNDTLRFTAQKGIGGTYSPGIGFLTLSGRASVADYEAALRSVSFVTDPDAPAGERRIAFEVEDGEASSNVVVRDVHVNDTRSFLTAQPGLTPAFSPDVSDYATRCDGNSPVDVSVSAPPGTTVSIDGSGARAGDFATPVDLSAGQGFGFSVSRHGQEAGYHVRCLPADFPSYEATVSGPRQSQWYLVAPLVFAHPDQYAAIYDSNGVPVWWKQSGDTPAFDFQLLADGNVGWSSRWAGSPTYSFNEFALDGRLVGTTSTVGVPTDFHDYRELPNGHRLLLSYPVRQHVDLSAYTHKAEDTDAAMYEAEWQELGAAGNLIWSWNSTGHIALAETDHWWADAQPEKTSDGRNLYDPVHINSVQDDGNGVIFTGRHEDAVYRVDKASGAIDWKIGGTARAESLAILGDQVGAGADFGGPHGVRTLPDGTLTLHDNGTGRGRAPRALRFRLDTAARTATLVESLTDRGAPSSFCCGSARRLPGGNWVMSWGGNGLVTEQAPDGTRRFALTFGGGLFSYRADPVLPGVLSAESLRAGMDAQHPRP